MTKKVQLTLNKKKKLYCTEHGLLLYGSGFYIGFRHPSICHIEKFCNIVKYNILSRDTVKFHANMLLMCQISILLFSIIERYNNATIPKKIPYYKIFCKLMRIYQHTHTNTLTSLFLQLGILFKYLFDVVVTYMDVYGHSWT